MKKIILVLTLFLLIGTVAAVNIHDLKVPIGYNEETEGYYYLNTDEDTHLYIGKLSMNEEAFNNTTDYAVYGIGDNLYAFEDNGLKSYGIQEKVKIDGEDYLVSIDKITPLDNVDKTMFKDDLKDFNKLNNFEPVAI